MFDFTDNSNTPPSSALRDLRAFVAEHADGLAGAAALLGGAPGFRIALAALDGLCEPGCPVARTMRALDKLVDLLMLEHVQDPDRIESVCFAALDPAEPVVEEVCLLADGLSNLLEAYRAEAREMVSAEVAA
ncbi:MAG: hypothetical protein ABJE00_06855 [Erythrobacter sp.]